MNKNIELSVIIPCFKCEQSLKELYERLVVSLNSISEEYEIIFINDASPQKDWEVIQKICSENKKAKGINLSKNFGEYYAITAGLEKSSGKWVIVMDGDLQDSPEEIKNLYQKAQENFDIVFAKRIMRKDGILKKLFSKIFYKLFSYLTDTVQNETINNFGIYKRNAVNAILSMQEKTKFFPVMVQWIGFKKTSMEVIHCERKYGKSSYSFAKLFDLALNTMLSFSDKPLKLTIRLGIIIVISSFIFALYVIFEHYFLEAEITRGWASLMVSIWFLSGLLIMILGILSFYISKIFEEVKNRPLYIIKDEINI